MQAHGTQICLCLHWWATELKALLAHISLSQPTQASFDVRAKQALLWSLLAIDNFNVSYSVTSTLLSQGQCLQENLVATLASHQCHACRASGSDYRCMPVTTVADALSRGVET